MIACGIEPVTLASLMGHEDVRRWLFSGLSVISPGQPKMDCQSSPRNWPRRAPAGYFALWTLT